MSKLNVLSFRKFAFFKRIINFDKFPEKKVIKKSVVNIKKKTLSIVLQQASNLKILK